MLSENDLKRANKVNLLTEYDAVRKQFNVCHVYPTAWKEMSVMPPETAETI